MQPTRRRRYGADTGTSGPELIFVNAHTPSIRHGHGIGLPTHVASLPLLTRMPPGRPRARACSWGESAAVASPPSIISPHGPLTVTCSFSFGKLHFRCCMFVAWYGILVLLNVCLASTLALTYVAQARAQAWHVCARGASLCIMHTRYSTLCRKVGAFCC